MSAARNNAMAQIGFSLDSGQSIIPKKTPTHVYDPHVAPGMLPDEQQPTIQDNGQVQVQETTPIQRTTNVAANKTSNLLSRGKAKVASLPNPGGLAFPIIILFVFFLLLLPVNKHTRLQWLWLVITGNATLTGENQTNSSTSSDNSVVPPAQTPQIAGPGNSNSGTSVASYMPPSPIGGPTGVTYYSTTFTGASEVD